MRRIWFSILVLALAVLSLIFWDQEITAFFMPGGFYRFRRISRYLTDVGEASFWFALCLATITIGWAERRQLLNRLSFVDEAVRQKIRSFSYWGSTTIYSMLASGLLLHALKWTIGRQRPHMTDTYEPHVFIGWTQDWHFQSMPSGHSQVFFAVAANIAEFYPNRAKWIYLVSFLFALTRVFTTQHFFSDVLVGCLIGYWVARAIIQNRKQTA